MLSLLSSLLVAQLNSPVVQVERQYITQPQEVRTLPGKLNNILVFNSNSPEVIKNEGILLSTFPSQGKLFSQAHLNQALQGRFDFFSHHIARPQQQRTLYQGVIVHNPTSKPITIRVIQALSYLTAPDAPFVDLPPQIEDPVGVVFSGPGSRLAGDMLRGLDNPNLPNYVIIPPGKNRILLSLPIPTSSARSTLMRLYSDGPVYMANLAIYGSPNNERIAQQKSKEVETSTNKLRQPSLTQWEQLLIAGKLIEPRDLPPSTLSNITEEDVIYSRVAGVSIGSEWIARVVDKPGSSYLNIPQSKKAFSYPLSTVHVGTQGTRQVQSAPMAVRYNDTALFAHGNYGVHYNLLLPLRNNTDKKQTVSVSLQTPVKQDRHQDRLFFVTKPQGQVFFRGTVRVAYRDDLGKSQVRYFHLVQRRGQQGEPLLVLNLSPKEVRQVHIDFIYPPDATPPQVLTVKTE